MKTIVSILLLSGAILTAAFSDDAVPMPSKSATREQAIKAVSFLRIGMRKADANMILTKYGLSCSGAGLMGTGLGYTEAYHLSDGATLSLTFRSKNYAFRRDEAAYAEDTLSHASICSWTNGTEAQISLELQSTNAQTTATKNSSSVRAGACR